MDSSKGTNPLVTVVTPFGTGDSSSQRGLLRADSNSTKLESEAQIPSRYSWYMQTFRRDLRKGYRYSWAFKAVRILELSLVIAITCSIDMDRSARIRCGLDILLCVANLAHFAYMINLVRY